MNAEERFYMNCADAFERRFFFGSTNETTATTEEPSNMTLELLTECMEKLKPRKPIAVGIAMSPATKEYVICSTFSTPHTTIPIGNLFGFNVIIDPRLGEKSELFYDDKAWRERCAEQRRWDAGEKE